MFKLLAVDVPSASGPTRLYLEGGPDTYERGGVLRELRDPFVNAMALQRAHEAEDDDDDAADAAAARNARVRVRLCRCMCTRVCRCSPAR